MMSTTRFGQLELKQDELNLPNHRTCHIQIFTPTEIRLINKFWSQYGIGDHISPEVQMLIKNLTNAELTSESHFIEASRIALIDLLTIIEKAGNIGKPGSMNSIIGKLNRAMEFKS